MYIATCIMALGYTRVNGLIAYNQSDKSFPLITPARAKKMINAGELKGVQWIKNDETGQLEFIPDVDGWKLSNIMVLSGLTYRPFYEKVGDSIQNSIYSVVRVIEKDNRKLYEVVSNTFQRIELTDIQLVGLADITEVGGVVIEENGEIRPLEGVMVDIIDSTKGEQDDTEKVERKLKGSRRLTSNTASKSSTTKRKTSIKKK